MRCIKLIFHLKKQFTYKEKNEEKRKIFLSEIETIDEKMLVYIDEAGIDNDEVYEYGWAKIGDRLHDTKPGEATQRLSMISALNSGDLIAL